MRIAAGIDGDKCLIDPPESARGTRARALSTHRPTTGCSGRRWRAAAEPERWETPYHPVGIVANAFANAIVVTIADLINSLLLLVAIVGIGLTWWQVRAGAMSSRASFLKDLYSTLRFDTDICDAFYQIEYGHFRYSDSFHGSVEERKLDRLLAFADLVCELHGQGVLTAREMEFFRYTFLRVIGNPEVRRYLSFLTGFYRQVGVQREPFHALSAYGRDMGVSWDAGSN